MFWRAHRSLASPEVLLITDQIQMPAMSAMSAVKAVQAHYSKAGITARGNRQALPEKLYGITK